MNPYRSHTCGELRPQHIGSAAVLAGWVDSRRDHGGVIFLDLRDRHGITQVVFRPEEHPQAALQAHELRAEDVVRVEGKVTARLPGTENPKLPTGEIEVVASSLEVLAKAEPLPFPLDAENVSEDLRLQHRYLDLRRPAMRRILELRHAMTKAARDFFDSRGFLEVETPILSKSTPEGAREFLVPSRLLPGHFYALAQSPQQYKQLLMVGGVERYFQVARCFRDEDPRSDRVTELTQIDVEMAFATEDDIFELVESMLVAVFRSALGREIPTPFDRLTYREALDRFGTDKPDRRFGLEICDLSDVFRQSQFQVFRAALEAGGVVKALNARGLAGITTGQIERLTEVARRSGAKGLAFIKIENGEWKSPIVKFFSDGEKAALAASLDARDGDLILFGADRWEAACSVLGRVRLECAELLALPREGLDFLWVVDFPLLAWSPEEQKWHAVHHPFTRPKIEDLPLLERGEFGSVRARAYDVVLNGVEIGGGSLRIHERDLQEKMFEVLGISEEKRRRLFPHLLEAFRYGAPPHGGVALGLDRLVMLAAGISNIRDVIAFPKTARGEDLMMGAPTPAEPKALRELRLRVEGPPSPAAAGG